jgi:hypothetical protein
MVKSDEIYEKKSLSIDKHDTNSKRDTKDV